MAVWVLRFLLALVLVAFQASAVTNVWFAPGGKGDGSSRNSPRSYYPDLLKWKLLGSDKSIDRTVVMHFLPGEYLIHPINTETVVPSEFSISIRGEGARPEDTVLKLVPNYPEGASEGGGGWVSVIDLARNDEYLRRFVMENITVDGNWEGQTNYNHLGYLRGYKNSPVNVSARTGRIRKVIVRNFGAHGLMPHRMNDLGEGVEAFPLFVTTREEGQDSEDGDPCPWIIEECEVSGFTGLYNGYSSALMVVTKVNVPEAPSWALKDRSRRLVWFRRNQVRGVPQQAGVIGLGAAGVGTNYSGRVTWSDNVILNGSGFNTDTGALWDLDLTNSLFLDVIALGYLGSPYSGQPSHRRYRLENNSIRLGGYLFAADYTDFGFEEGSSVPRLDPSLVLGRRRVYGPSGLSVGGIAEEIALVGNWFTTRPWDQFRGRQLPDGTDPMFRLVYRMPSKDPDQPKKPAIPRYDAINVDMAGNSLSSAPFDFTSMKPVDGGRVARLSENASPILGSRRPLTNTDRFTPYGSVQRVVAFYTNQARSLAFSGPARGDDSKARRRDSNVVDRVLSGVCEVTFGIPVRSVQDGVLTVPVRVTVQPTPMSGGATRPLARRAVTLEVLPGSLHPQKLTASTDAEGIVRFSYPVFQNRHGMDFFRAWTDFGQGNREVWDENQDAWAICDYSHGSTVSVSVDTSVCDARNGNAAVFRFHRTGRVDQPLTVDFGPPGPAMAEAGIDFEWAGPGLGAVSQTITLPPGEREVVLLARPIPRTARMGRLIQVSVLPGEGYGVGFPAKGAAVLYAPGK